MSDNNGTATPAPAAGRPSDALVVVGMAATTVLAVVILYLVFAAVSRRSRPTSRTATSS